MVPNPFRQALLLVGTGLARLGLIDREHVERATELSWPRIVTGIARMSKAAADVAMVGLAVGPAAIAGVGFASPFWGLAFALGGGIAGGTISMVSQRFGAEAWEELALAVKAGAFVAFAITLPLTVGYFLFSEFLIELIGSGEAATGYGAEYLRIVGFGVPFAALNLIGSRTLVGADDAWTAMVLRAGGAVINVAVNGVLIFGLDMGVVGAAIGTVASNVVVTAAFGIGLAAGRLPGIGAFPVRVPLSGPHLDLGLVGDLLRIGTPLVGTNLARTGAQFPQIYLVGLFGPKVVAAYVVALRVRGLMGTPGWGFSLASSSLVGQALGEADESAADAWAKDVIRFSVAVYLLVAGAVAVFAEQVGRLFVEDPSILGLVVTFIYVACLSITFKGVDGGATGPLRASGDTRWPLYSQLVGMYVVALPAAYLGTVVPAIGIYGVFAMMILQTSVPAAITYYRYRTGVWKAISREYRPDSASVD
ncbi:MATE family efflux transporter [Haloparvum sp. PAK95]|uniref:MATE family efflux transporter n=1 Tax=Haloparvum sp. PAK95 TaxID=3418962 RepID=UPI003D2F4441